MTGLTAAMNAHRRDVRHLARHQILGLTAQFLLGMAVDLLGLPSKATGATQTASTVFLAARAHRRWSRRRCDPCHRRHSRPDGPVAPPGDLR